MKKIFGSAVVAYPFLSYYFFKNPLKLHPPYKFKSKFLNETVNSKEEVILNVAHRGGSHKLYLLISIGAHEHIENTIEAFEHAVRTIFTLF